MNLRFDVVVSCSVAAESQLKFYEPAIGCALN
jgi:hypothetical protein